jgi:hypothetical protein
MSSPYPAEPDPTPLLNRQQAQTHLLDEKLQPLYDAVLIQARLNSTRQCSASCKAWAPWWPSSRGTPRHKLLERIFEPARQISFRVA